jgi:hypothetical protein
VIHATLGADRVPLSDKVTMLMGGSRDYTFVPGKKGKPGKKVYSPMSHFSQNVSGAYPQSGVNTSMAGIPGTGSGIVMMGNPRSSGMYSGGGAMSMIGAGSVGSGFATMAGVKNSDPDSGINSVIASLKQQSTMPVQQVQPQVQVQYAQPQQVQPQQGGPVTYSVLSRRPVTYTRGQYNKGPKQIVYAAPTGV